MLSEEYWGLASTNTISSMSLSVSSGWKVIVFAKLQCQGAVPANLPLSRSQLLHSSKRRQIL